MKDWQMLKSTDPDVINLAIGEPLLLERMACAMIRGIENIGLVEAEYPSMGGYERLVELIKEEHPDKHVVVTNGAKQGILAAIHSLRSPALSSVQFKTPCWPSYFSLPDLIGMTPIPIKEYKLFEPGKHITCVTSPNNPDGAITSGINCDIWDAAYQSDVYGAGPTETRARIAVYTASKLYGLPGARVGWAVTEDGALANRMSEYIEMTTSGVSNISQFYVADLMDRIRLRPAGWLSLMEDVKKSVQDNTESFNYLNDYIEVVDGVPNHGKGMFAWFKVKDKSRFDLALKTAKVKMVEGWACGEFEPGWYRMNMFQDTELTKRAVDAIVMAHKE